MKNWKEFKKNHPEDYKKCCGKIYLKCKCKLNDENLVKALEEIFSHHDSDMIYNVLQEFRGIDTNQGEITFDDFINENY